MRGGEFSTMMQQQKEDESQKSMEKEQRAMTSTLTGKALLLVQSVLSLHHFLQSSVTQNSGVASKVTTLATDSMFFFADRSLRLQAVFRVAEKNATVDVGQHYTNLSSLGMICNNRLVITTESITNRATANFSVLPIYDLRSLGYILYHHIFGSRICNFDCQKINLSLLFLYTISSLSLKFLLFCFNLYQEYLKIMKILENKD